YDISASAYNPANSITTFNLATTQTVQNTAPASVGAASGTTVATPSSNTLPTNSLFTPTTNPTAGYLIETNPRFANYRTWLSSDYMLSQLSYDPATQTKRLGDGFYEQRLIREQVNQLTGQRFLAGYADEETQYQALMQHGITAASSFQLTPGIALSAAQVAELTSDIVWLVEQSVTLPNGTVTKALVPRVYAKLQAGDISNTGALLAGNSVQLKLTSPSTSSGQSGNNAGTLFNSGTIGSRTLLALNTNNLHNLGGIISGHDVNLTATQDINNLGGTITAQNSLTLNAGRDINVVSTTQSSANQVGASSFTRTNLDRVAGLYVTGGQGLLEASAGNDMHLDAAQLINTAPTGAGNPSATNLTLLKAGNNLTLGTVQIAEQNNSIRNPKNYLKHGSTQDIGTDIQTAGDITLMAGHDLHIKAANITSSDGDLLGIAGKDLTVTSGESTSNMSAARYVKKSGSFSSKKTTTRDTFNDSNAIGSNLSANAINLVAGAQIAEDGNVSTQVGQGNLTIKGSNVVATQDVNLNAGADINVIAAQDTHTETHYKKETKSGFSASSTSIGYSSSKLKTTNDTQTTTHVASTIGSIEGDVTINAGKVYTQTASDVLTPKGDINIAAQQVNIVAGQDTHNNQQTMKYKQTGLTLAISSPVISAIQTVNQMKEAASQTKDGRMQLLAAGTAALAASNALDAVSAGQAATPTGNATQDVANQVGGINISLSIGTSKSSSETTQTSSTAASSTLNAGGDITITAIGAGKESDINIIGSQIKAAHDVTLKAEDQINLIAAQNVDTLDSKNKGSSASLGIGFSLGGSSNGFTINAGVSGNKGKANGNDSTWTETVVQSGNNTGDKVTLQSGTDTNVIGSQVIGNQIVANVGTNPLTGETGHGNLNIQSLQDSSTYKDKQSNFGVSVSLCIPPFCVGASGGSVSAGQSKTKSNYASVNEQAGFFAGNEGFQANVAGNTNLTGAVMASTDQAVKQNLNSLTTQTLTITNIENSAAYSAKGASFSAGVGLNQQPGGTGYKNAPTASAGSANLSDNSSSVTVSGISAGTLSVTDNPLQVATVNRDVQTQLTTTTDNQGNIQTTATAIDSQGNDLAGTLTPIFDKDQVQRELNAQIQITQAFSAVAPKAVGDYAGNKFKELTAQGNTEEAAKWADGGIYRIALHTALGGLLTGDISGALGAGAVASAAPLLNDLQAKVTEALQSAGLESIDPKTGEKIPSQAANMIAQALAELTSVGIGSAIGGTGGAGTALAVDTNNRQLHP
ncbi:MAG: hemagglutinin repeat-containing protein, partial [Moraxellaceae bacterium]|nr:hemagglutinin repeat-containing protein [Moraxellaceae bacterium]